MARDPKRPHTGAANTREERLAAALRANLRRRKLQARVKAGRLPEKRGHAAAEGENKG
jgi:hypothetical protein